MKQIFNLLLLFSVLLMGLNACKDECKNKNCMNGSCLEGSCKCDTGYIVDTMGICALARNSLFVGQYNLNRTCNSGSSNSFLGVIVDAGNSPTSIIVRDFMGAANNDVTIKIDDQDNILIEQQTTTAGNSISGSGTRSNSVLAFTIYYNSDTCQVSMTKQ